MSRIQIERGVIPQICKATNELEIWHTVAALSDFTPKVTFPAQYAGQVYWESGGVIYPATSGVDTVIPGTGETHRATLRGLPVDQITVLDCATNAVTRIGAGDMSTWKFQPKLTDFRISTTLLSGDISGWKLPATLATLRIYNTSLSGDISGWILPDSLATLYLYTTSLSGDISGWILPDSLVDVRLYSTSVTVGSKFTGVGVGLRAFQIQNCGLIQAHVDNVVESIWNARAGFTYATPTLNVGGTNAAPSGLYVAPPGEEASNDDWEWSVDHYIPLTGLAMVYDLENDVNSEGFNTWTVTYTVPP